MKRKELRAKTLNAFKSEKENRDSYNQKASLYLHTLCDIKPDRRTGSSGNRDAITFFTQTMTQWEYSIDASMFPCLDFETGEVSLACGDTRYEVFTSPFSPGCHVTAGIAAVSSVEELEQCECNGKILLLHGSICAEQLMPKNFVFYNPDSHKRIYSLLEKKDPAAIITAVGKNPGIVGGEYPYPMIEDGDFDIPSVYCKDTTGRAIAQKAGSVFTLVSGARRIPSHACNVIAGKNPEKQNKIVVCAHIDTRANTPGALDNASGITILLLLAELLEQNVCTSGVELIAFNGEDYYSAGGQMDYLRRYEHEFDKITVAINLDGIGYREGKTAYSFYGCPDLIHEKAGRVFTRCNGIMEGDPWHQGDHMVFVQKGVPAIALTSEKTGDLLPTITHTPRDTPEIVDTRKLVEAVFALKDFIIQ